MVVFKLINNNKKCFVVVEVLKDQRNHFLEGEGKKY